jgi:hypothetical protein
MPIVTLNALTTTDIYASGTYTVQVSVGLLGTLNVAGGGALAPIEVTIDGLAGLGVLYNVDVSDYATLIYAPATGLSIGANFNIGSNADGFGSTPGHGTLELGSGLTFGVLNSLNFAGTDNTLILDDGFNVGVLVNGISGWGSGDVVAFQGQTVTDTTYIDHMLTVTFANGLTEALQFNGEFTNSQFLAVDGAVVFVCFLRGTMIATPDGEIPVETLAVGDLVTTLSGRAMPVKWVGSRHIDARSMQRPELAQPVCIRRGAMSTNVPRRDLMLSPDHAIMAGGKLVPVKLLVNGATVFQRRDITDIDYFHVELDSHEIILADGAPVESYLDTGNRGFFANGGEPVHLHPDFSVEPGHPARLLEGCMQLTTQASDVKPLWQAVADRAEWLGIGLPAAETSVDPMFQVMANGQPCPCLAEQGNGRRVFLLPAGASEVVMLSRYTVPNDLTPWIDDRRQLGVAISRIVLRQGSELREIPIDHPALAGGWHDCERQGTRLSRWTNGQAQLKLPAAWNDDPATLELVIEPLARYFLSDVETFQKTAIGF